jgi:hypothetical protein
LADLKCNCWSKSRIGRQAHHLQHLPGTLLCDEVKERRLFELDGEPLTEGLVEHGIAGSVGEVRKHQHIFVRERFGLLALLPHEDSGSCKNQHGNGSDPVLQ